MKRYEKFIFLILILLHMGGIKSQCEESFTKDLSILTLHFFLAKMPLKILEQTQIKMIPGSDEESVYKNLNSSLDAAQLLTGQVEVEKEEHDSLEQMQDLKKQFDPKEQIEEMFHVDYYEIDAQCTEDQEKFVMEMYLMQSGVELTSTVSISGYHTVNSKVSITIAFEKEAEGKKMIEIVGDRFTTFYRPVKTLGEFVRDYYLTYVLQVPLKDQDTAVSLFTLNEHFSPRAKNGDNTLTFCTPDPDPRMSHGEVLPYLQAGKVWIFMDMSDLKGSDFLMQFQFDLEVQEEREVPSELFTFPELHSEQETSGGAERGYFLGLSGIKMNHKEVANLDFKGDLYKADYLFDMKENFENYFKASKGLVDGSVGGKVKGELDSQYMLIRALGYDLTDLKTRISMESEMDTQQQMLPSLVTENLGKMERKNILALVKKIMVINGYQFFESPAAIDAILALKKAPEKYIQFVRVIEDGHDLTEQGSADETSSEEFAVGEVYEYSTHMLTPSLHMNISNIGNNDFNTLLQMGSSKVVIKREKLAVNYFGKVSEGTIIKISFMIDSKKLQDLQSNTEQLVGKGGGHDLDEDIVSVQETQSWGMNTTTHGSNEVRTKQDSIKLKKKHRSEHSQTSLASQESVEVSLSKISTTAQKGSKNSSEELDSEKLRNQEKAVLKELYKNHPFEETMTDIENGIGTNQTPVLVENLEITRFMMTQFLERLIIEFNINHIEGAFLIVSYKKAGKSDNFIANEMGFDEFYKMLPDALIHTQRLENYKIDGTTYKLVDQISYCLKMRFVSGKNQKQEDVLSNAMYYLVFQIPHLEPGKLELGEYLAKIFMTNELTPSEISTTEIADYDLTSLSIYDEFEGVKVMEFFLRIMEGMVFSRGDNIAPFELAGDNVDGKIEYSYDKEKGHAHHEFETKSQSWIMSQALENNPIEGQYYHTNYCGIYYGEDKFKVEMWFKEGDNPDDPFDPKNHQVFRYSLFKVSKTWGHCPERLVDSFQRTSKTQCKKIYGDNQLEYSFYDDGKIQEWAGTEFQETLDLSTKFDQNKFNQFIEKEEDETDSKRQNRMKVEENPFQLGMHYVLRKTYNLDIQHLYIGEDGARKDGASVSSLAETTYQAAIKEAKNQAEISPDEMSSWLLSVVLANNQYLQKSEQDSILLKYIIPVKDAETLCDKYSKILKTYQLDGKKLVDYRPDPLKGGSELNLGIDGDGDQMKGETPIEKGKIVQQYLDDMKNNPRYFNGYWYMENRQAYHVTVSFFKEVSEGDMMLRFGLQADFKLYIRPTSRMILLV